MFPFARPYDDELLAGAVMRGCRHFMVSVSAVGEQLHARRGWKLTFLTSGHIERFAELLQVDVDVLLWEHTLHPYVTSFRDSADYSKKTGDRPGARSSAGTTQLIARGEQARRSCLRCIRRELEIKGETYWHRSHQLPGVLHCWDHGTPLMHAKLGTSGPIADLFLPHDAPYDSQARRVSASWKLVAEASVHLLNRSPMPGEYRGGDFYRSLAERRGWLDAGSPHAQGALIRAIEAFYGKDLLDSAGIGLKGSSWPSLMMQPDSGVPFSTLKHVVLEQFLRHDGPQSTFQFSHRPSGPRGRPKSELDRKYVDAANRQLRSLRAAGTKVSTRAWLSGAGCWQAYRHGPKSSLPHLTALVEKFKSGDMALRQELRLPLDSETSRASPRSLVLLRDTAAAISVPVSSSNALGGQPTADGTRLELIRSGALLSSKQMAERLGVHWTEMKAMARANRIFNIVYGTRDFYPTFWCVDITARDGLEALCMILAPIDGPSKFRFFTGHINDLGESPIGAVLHGRLAEVVPFAELLKDLIAYR